MINAIKSIKMSSSGNKTNYNYIRDNEHSNPMILDPFQASAQPLQRP
jgi:hypothetical protein